MLVSNATYVYFYHSKVTDRGENTDYKRNSLITLLHSQFIKPTHPLTHVTLNNLQHSNLYNNISSRIWRKGPSTLSSTKVLKWSYLTCGMPEGIPLSESIIRQISVRAICNWIITVAENPSAESNFCHRNRFIFFLLKLACARLSLLS